MCRYLLVKQVSIGIKASITHMIVSPSQEALLLSVQGHELLQFPLGQVAFGLEQNLLCTSSVAPCGTHTQHTHARTHTHAHTHTTHITHGTMLRVPNSVRLLPGYFSLQHLLNPGLLRLNTHARSHTHTHTHTHMHTLLFFASPNSARTSLRGVCDEG